MLHQGIGPARFAIVNHPYYHNRNEYKSEVRPGVGGLSYPFTVPNRFAKAIIWQAVGRRHSEIGIDLLFVHDGNRGFLFNVSKPTYYY